MHVGEPGREPESLQRLEGGLAQDERRGEPPEIHAREDAAEQADLLAERFSLAGKRALGHDEIDERAGGHSTVVISSPISTGMTTTHSFPISQKTIQKPSAASA